IITGAPLSGRAAAVAGAAIGWLVWLHVRFVVLAFGLFLWMLWTYRRNRRVRMMLTLACAGVTGALCLSDCSADCSIVKTACSRSHLRICWSFRALASCCGTTVEPLLSC